MAIPAWGRRFRSIARRTFLRNHSTKIQYRFASKPPGHEPAASCRRIGQNRIERPSLRARRRRRPSTGRKTIRTSGFGTIKASVRRDDRSKVDHTLKCVEQALQDAKLTPAQIDNVLLVGGSTRTPLVRELLEDYFQKEPRIEINPDLCVAMGSAILAARIQGVEVKQILVDITPHTFGVSAVYIDDNGLPTPYYYTRLIPRNTPLPVTRSEEFTTHGGQSGSGENRCVPGRGRRRSIQHENRDVSSGRSCARPGRERRYRPNVVGFEWDFDRHLYREKHGIAKIDQNRRAYKPQNAEDIAKSRSRITEILEPTSSLERDGSRPENSSQKPNDNDILPAEHREVIQRAQSAYDRMHPDDRKEAEEYASQIEQLARDQKPYDEPLHELQELLYFVGV